MMKETIRRIEKNLAKISAAEANLAILVADLEAAQKARAKQENSTKALDDKALDEALKTQTLLNILPQKIRNAEQQLISACSSACAEVQGASKNVAAEIQKQLPALRQQIADYLLPVCGGDKFKAHQSAGDSVLYSHAVGEYQRLAMFDTPDPSVLPPYVRFLSSIAERLEAGEQIFKLEIPTTKAASPTETKL